MSLVRKCDLCGKEFGEEYPMTIFRQEGAKLTVFDFDDGYNTEPYEVELDICSACVSEKFTKEEIMEGMQRI